jgi:hypothetical protein
MFCEIPSRWKEEIIHGKEAENLGFSYPSKKSKLREEIVVCLISYILIVSF